MGQEINTGLNFNEFGFLVAPVKIDVDVGDDVQEGAESQGGPTGAGCGRGADSLFTMMVPRSPAAMQLSKIRIPAITH